MPSPLLMVHGLSKHSFSRKALRQFIIVFARLQYFKPHWDMSLIAFSQQASHKIPFISSLAIFKAGCRCCCYFIRITRLPFLEKIPWTSLPATTLLRPSFTQNQSSEHHPAVDGGKGMVVKAWWQRHCRNTGMIRATVEKFLFSVHTYGVSGKTRFTSR